MSPRDGMSGNNVAEVLVRLAEQADERGDVRAALILLNVARLLEEALQPSSAASR